MREKKRCAPLSSAPRSLRFALGFLASLVVVGTPLSGLRAEPPTPSTSAPSASSMSLPFRWAEIHAGRFFLPLPDDPALLKRLAKKSQTLRSLHASYIAWISPLSKRSIGSFALGDGYKIYEAARSEVRHDCKIRRFVILTRGTPHVATVESAREGQPPKEPTCGQPALAAELACSSPPPASAEMYQHPSLFALPSASAPPRHFIEDKAASQASYLPKLARLFHTKPTFQKAFEEAKKAADKKKQPLQEIQTTRIFKHPQESYLFYSRVLQTGEGNQLCAAEDVRIEVIALVKLNKDGSLGEVIGEPAVFRDPHLYGILALPGLSTPFLMSADHFNQRRLLQAPLWTAAAKISYDYCDCSC